MVSNPGTLYWMVVSETSYYNGKIMKIMVAKWGTPKKYLKTELKVVKRRGSAPSFNAICILSPKKIFEMRMN